MMSSAARCQILRLLNLFKSGSGKPALRSVKIAASEIIDRCIYALVNEGARILQEGYALRASDIDIICLNGYGFPAHRCGPMWYADTVGLKKGLRAILRIASPAWRNLAARAPTVATRRTKQDFRRFRQGRGAAA
jgi:3-hydroxyacyl-CoA dehydrogenase